MWVQDVSSWITPVPDGRPNSSVSDVSQGARALVLPLPRHRLAWELGRRFLIEHRDMAAAQAFFRSAQAVTGVTPDQVTTDGHDSYPSAIRTTLGKGVRHRTSTYLNNRLEQDHRGIKGRYRPMRVSNARDQPLGSAAHTMNSATFSASAPATISMCSPIARDCFTSRGS
jgi:hypothetical protein